MRLPTVFSIILLAATAAGCPTGLDPQDDGGRWDSSPDMGSAGSAVVYRSRSGKAIWNVDTKWNDIDSGKLTMQIDSGGADYLFFLNAPDTWTNNSEEGHFRILVDGSPLATGLIHGAGLQRVPITLVGVKELPRGKHTVRAQWRDPIGSSLNIGAEHATWLVAVRADRGVQYAKSALSGPTHKGDPWSDISAIAHLKVDSTGCDYLLILNVPESILQAGDQHASFGIAVDGKVDPNMAVIYHAAFAGQRVPVTAVGVTSLSAGTHTIKARWRTIGANYYTIGLGTNHPAWLVALRVPRGIQRGYGPDGLTRSSPTSWADFFVQPTVSLSGAGDHLFILNASETGVDPKDRNGFYRIVVDSSPLASGVFTSTMNSTRTPITLIGVKKLSAGAHPVRAQWKTSSGGTMYQVGQYRTLLAGFAP